MEFNPLHNIEHSMKHSWRMLRPAPNGFTAVDLFKGSVKGKDRKKGMITVRNMVQIDFEYLQGSLMRWNAVSAWQENKLIQKMKK